MMLLLVALVFIFTMYIMTMSLFLSGPAAWFFFFGLAVFWIGYRQVRIYQETKSRQAIYAYAIKHGTKGMRPWWYIR